MAGEKGFIPLWRDMLDWQWWDDRNVRDLYITMLLLANHKEKMWKGMTIKAGSFATSIAALSQKSGLSVKAVRTALTKLKETNEIAIKTTNQFSVITVVNWAKYQAPEDAEGKQNDTQEGKQTANEGQTKGKPRATNNNITIKQDTKEKKINKEKKVTEDADEVIDYLNQKTGSRYQHSEASRKHIIARLRDFTVEECKTVIDKKTAEWQGDPKMEKFLRPETLFGSKFEGYLNQPESTRRDPPVHNSQPAIVIPVPDYMRKQIDGEMLGSKQKATNETLEQVRQLQERMKA